MKKQTPILFNTEMVRAIEIGSKTQTRRIAKTQPIKGLHLHVSKDVILDASDRESWTYSDPQGLEKQSINCPFGSVGDLLWIREKWRPLVKCQTGEALHQAFYAEMPEAFHQMYPKKWKPSIHMKKKHTRIWLEITNVRLELLHSISESDAQAEGMPRYDEHMDAVEIDWLSAKYGFKLLWSKIFGENSWNSNPWVWVVEFKIFENIKKSAL